MQSEKGALQVEEEPPPGFETAVRVTQARLSLSCGSGLGALGFGCRPWDLGFVVQASGLRVEEAWLVQGSGFRV